jgi:drug/metabolite transporter (DMT)-like permease
MNEPQRKWLFYSVVLATVFLLALSMDMPRMFGWGFFALTFVIVAPIILALQFFVMTPIVVFWRGASKKKKFAVASAVFGFLLALNIVMNHGKPDAVSEDWNAFFVGCFGLLLWGCYCIFSRFLDRLWERFSRR